MNEKTKKLTIFVVACAAVIGAALAGSAFTRMSIQEERIESTRKSIECESLELSIRSEMNALSIYDAEDTETIMKMAEKDGKTTPQMIQIIRTMKPMQSSWEKLEGSERDRAINRLGSKVCMGL